MSTKRIAILSYANVALFEMACAVELFGLPRPEFECWYQCDVVTFEEGAFQTTAGLLPPCVSIVVASPDF